MDLVGKILTCALNCCYSKEGKKCKDSRIDNVNINKCCDCKNNLDEYLCNELVCDYYNIYTQSLTTNVDSTGKNLSTNIPLNDILNYINDTGLLSVLNKCLFQYSTSNTDALNLEYSKKIVDFYVNQLACLANYNSTCPLKVVGYIFDQNGNSYLFTADCYYNSTTQYLYLNNFESELAPINGSSYYFYITTEKSLEKVITLALFPPTSPLVIDNLPLNITDYLDLSYFDLSSFINQGPLGNCYIENYYNIGVYNRLELNFFTVANIYLNILSKYTKNNTLELCLYYPTSINDEGLINYNESKIFLYVEDEQFYAYTCRQCIISITYEPFVVPLYPQYGATITNQKLYLTKEICQ